MCAEALACLATMDAVGTLYAPEFIARNPAGMRAGRNDALLRGRMTQAYAPSRHGATAMRIRDLRLSPIDALHWVAHVA